MATTTTTTTASSRVIILASLVLALTACWGEAARSPAAAPPSETATAPSPAGSACLNALYNMSDCLSYVQNGSNVTKPDKACCPELAGLVDSNPICLCQLLANPGAVGIPITIDVNKALKLPSVCRVTTPPVSKCSAAGFPVPLPPSKSASPSLAPKGSTTSPSSGASASSPGGVGNSSNEAAASPSGNNGNRASGIQAFSLTFILGLANVCASMFF